MITVQVSYGYGYIRGWGRVPTRRDPSNPARWYTRTRSLPSGVEIIGGGSGTDKHHRTGRVAEMVDLHITKGGRPTSSSHHLDGKHAPPLSR